MSRRFHALYGLPEAIVDRIVAECGVTKNTLLQTLFFLKTGASEDVAADHFKVARETLRNNVWPTILDAGPILSHHIDLSNRFETEFDEVTGPRGSETSGERTTSIFICPLYLHNRSSTSTMPAWHRYLPF